MDYNDDGWRDLEVEPERGDKIPCGAKAVFSIEEDDEDEEDDEYVLVYEYDEDDLELEAEQDWCFAEVLDLGQLGQYLRLSRCRDIGIDTMAFPVSPPTLREKPRDGGGA